VPTAALRFRVYVALARLFFRWWIDLASISFTYFAALHRGTKSVERVNLNVVGLAIWAVGIRRA
jgi:hypothetical protein